MRIYDLIRRVLQKQVYYMNKDPYANAFNAAANGRHYAPDRSGQTDWTWGTKIRGGFSLLPIALALNCGRQQGVQTIWIML